eukprot:Gb_02332 [translate_table: standard]
MSGATLLSSSICCTSAPKPLYIRQPTIKSSCHNLRISRPFLSFNGHCSNLLTTTKRPWGLPKGSRLDTRRSLRDISGLPSLEYNETKRRFFEAKALGGSANSPSDWYKPATLVKLWNNRIMPGLAQLTPLEASKWAAMAALLIGAIKLIVGVVLNPYVWAYGSWILVIWPWPAAVIIGLSCLFAAFKQSKGKAKEWEQVLILAGALIWLNIVPIAHINGYLEGWPILLFFVYFVFFLISSYIRYILYGDLSPRSDDKQWKTSSSRIAQIAFVASVVGGHWLAAYESPPLYLIPGGWNNILPLLVLFFAVALHYNATYYLGKYFDRLVVPQTVVVFGPYRWVRHPIYTSYMLLFAGYCIALRAYCSLAFLVVACFLYYEQRTKLEEDMLVEAFGDMYTSYRKKVRRKYIPFVY